MKILAIDCREADAPPDILIVGEKRFLGNNVLESAMRRFKEWEPSEIKRRQELGDTCYMVLDGEACVHYSWVTRWRRNIQEIGYRVNLNHRCHWIYNCTTAPSYRGRSLYPSVLRTIAQDIRRQGGDIAWIDIEATNQASLRGAYKAGFIDVATLEKDVYFSFIRCRRRQILDHPRFGKYLNSLPVNLDDRILLEGGRLTRLRLPKRQRKGLKEKLKTA